MHVRAVRKRDGQSDRRARVGIGRPRAEQEGSRCNGDEGQRCCENGDVPFSAPDRGGDRRIRRSECRFITQIKFEKGIADVAQSGLGILLQTSFEEHSNPLRRFYRKSTPIGVVLDHRCDHIDERLAPKRRPAGEHLIQHAAKRPDVRALIDRQSTRLLRTHVCGRPQDYTGARPDICYCRGIYRFGYPRRADPSEPEVEHLHRAVGTYFDVRGFQITMDDSPLVRRFERLGDLLRDGQGLLKRNRPLRDAVGERRSLDHLHHEGLDAVALFEAMNLADVGMVQRGERAGLAVEAGEPLRVVGERLGEDLDRHITPEFGVASAIHLPHASRADPLEDVVRTQPRPHRQWQG